MYECLKHRAAANKPKPPGLTRGSALEVDLSEVVPDQRDEEVQPCRIPRVRRRTPKLLDFCGLDLCEVGTRMTPPGGTANEWIQVLVSRGFGAECGRHFVWVGGSTCTTSAQHSLQMFRKHAVVSASIGFAKHASSPYSHSPCRQPPMGQACRRDKHHVTVNVRSRALSRGRHAAQDAGWQGGGDSRPGHQ